MGKQRGRAFAKQFGPRRQQTPWDSFLCLLPRPKLLFAIAMFATGVLLFAITPMFAKALLPAFSGATDAWNSCLAFYQILFFLGCLYVHLSLKWLSPRRQAVLHLLLLCIPWAFLPMNVSQEKFFELASWSTGASPITQLWMLSSASAGVFFFVVASGIPLLQAWFHRTKGRAARDPYFLFATACLGGLLALLAYPLLIESNVTMGSQSSWIAAGYAGVMLLTIACGVVLRRSPDAIRLEISLSNGAVKQRPTWQRRMHWLALSLVPTSLMMGVTSYISNGVGQAPLLWILPLAIYLLTFALVFERGANLPPAGPVPSRAVLNHRRLGCIGVASQCDVAAAVGWFAANGGIRRNRYDLPWPIGRQSTGGQVCDGILSVGIVGCRIGGPFQCCCCAFVFHLRRRIRDDARRRLLPATSHAGAQSGNRGETGDRRNPRSRRGVLRMVCLVAAIEDGLARMAFHRPSGCEGGRGSGGSHRGLLHAQANDSIHCRRGVAGSRNPVVSFRTLNALVGGTEFFR